MFDLPKSDGLNTVAFSKMFTSLTNSYKLFWFKAIFDHVIKGNSRISYAEIIKSMIEESFPFIHRFKLQFSVLDQLESCLRSIPHDYKGKGDYSSLSKVIDNRKLEKLHKEIKIYVPYRLVSSFYPNVKESTKNKVITEFLHTDEKALYKIDLESFNVTITKEWMDYINDNQNLILGWYKYHLIKFLQKRNPSTPNIPAKIDAVRENINDQRTFWKKVAQLEPRIDYDIYQNLAFTNHSQEKLGAFSLDHILPFDFVSHDLIWNLIPTHKNINSQKGTKLPSLQQIDFAIDKQYLFFETARKMDRLSKKEVNIMQEYSYLNPKLDYLDDSLNEETFKYILREQLYSLYSIAYNQGFEPWTNN